MKETSIEQKTMEQIFNQLKNKACLKQKAYKNIKDIFNQLKAEALHTVGALSKRGDELDNSIIVALNEISDFEFHIKFGSDLLVFILRSNIVTFGEEYPVMQSDYIKEKEDRKFFGSILVYNFMADSLKYNRVEDSGYLIARMLVNVENHFYIEGVRQLDFLFTDIKQNVISTPWLKLFIEKLMLTALDTDLIGIRYAELNKLTNYDRINQSLQLGTGQKIGFQMTYNQGNLGR